MYDINTIHKYAQICHKCMFMSNTNSDIWDRNRPYITNTEIHTQITIYINKDDKGMLNAATKQIFSSLKKINVCCFHVETDIGLN